MTELIVIAVLCVAGVVIYAAIRPRERTSSRPSTQMSPVVAGELTVTLPIDDVDPEAEATKRLAADAIHRAFAVEPDANVVIVRSRKGRELAREERKDAPAPRPFIDAPVTMRERAPAHLAGGAHAPSFVRFKEERELKQRTLAEHLDLPDVVRREIHDPDDAMDVVAGILHAAGVDDDREGNVIRCGDRAVVVLRCHPWDHIEASQLNAAYIRFLESGARSGVVVTPGALFGYEMKRREALVPELRHAGMDGIQRMADAVALGADPLDLAAGF